MIKSTTNTRIPDPRFFSKAVPAALAVPALKNLTVSQSYFSADIAAQFSIGGPWGSGSSNVASNKFAIRYEALLESDGEPVEPADGTLYEKVYAIGVTLDLTVQTTSVSVNFDIASVAAAVQLAMASASYNTTVYCADPTVLAKLLPVDGALNPDNYDQLVSSIGAVKEAMASTPGLAPQVYFRPARILPGIQSDLAVAQTIAFAVRCLSRGEQVKDAMNDATNNGLDSTLVDLVYRSFWPDVQDGQDPPDSAIKAAAAWLVDASS